MSFETINIIYFVYGLAFFSMGLILALEASRTPFLEQKQLLIPLALFGLLHGLHEWLEIFVLQHNHLYGSLAAWVISFRLLWLALTYIMLWFYGWQAFQVARKHFS